jgi:hypothetical protein
MPDANLPQRYQLDFSNYSCRIRIDGAKPGKQLRVLVKDLQDAAGELLHGSGVLSEDQSQFTATFPTALGEQTLVRDWKGLRAEIAGYPRYD